MLRASILVSLTLFFVACASPDKPSGSSTGRGEGPPPEVTPNTKEEEGWQRGTITVGPDGMFAIHADDDSATVCAFELAPELQQKDLAVHFRGELIPPAPNERRWCTLAENLQVEKVQ